MADEQAPAEKRLWVQKIYLKDFSYESPKTPEIFSSKVGAQTLLNVRSVNREIDTDNFEVTLILKVKSQAQEDTIFLIEVVQAGVFTIKGYTPEERSFLLGSFCPGTLFPFAREAVAHVVGQGGFPRLLLEPLDFNALYAENMQERAAQAAKAEPVSTAMATASDNDETR